MDKNILNKLKVNEQIVEMQECTLHDMNVIEVTLYKCIRKFGFKKIEIYTFPFYFASKELVEKFLKFYNYFEICHINLRWSGKHCISLKVQNAGPYHMVDAFKKKHYCEHESSCKFFSCTLDDKGIWNGELNDTSDMYPSNMEDNYNFMQLLDMCNIPIKGEKIYTFKMIEKE